MSGERPCLCGDCPAHPWTATQPSASQPDGLVEVLIAAIQADPTTDTPRWEARRLARHLAEAVRAHLAQTAPEPDAADLLAVTLAVDVLRSEQRDAVAVLDEVERRICGQESCSTPPDHDGCFVSDSLRIVRGLRAEVIDPEAGGGTV